MPVVSIALPHGWKDLPRAQPKGDPKTRLPYASTFR